MLETGNTIRVTGAGVATGEIVVREEGASRIVADQQRSADLVRVVIILCAIVQHDSAKPVDREDMTLGPTVVRTIKPD